MSVDLTTLQEELAAIGTTPVLNWTDREGYPASARVDVRVDGGKVHIDMPAGVTFNEGAASLMAHYMNERLWDLKSVVFRGALAPGEGSTWTFTPTKQVGSGRMGLRDGIALMRGATASANRYLDKRGMDRPKIAWDELKEMKKRAKEVGID